MKSIERYLAIVAITALLVPQPASAQAKKADADADQKEFYSYMLTVEKLHKLADATQDMKEWAKKHPETADEKPQISMDEGSISEHVKEIEAKVPAISAILRKYEFTTREYLVGILVLMQASILVSMKKSTQTEYSKEATALISPANLAFVEQHWDELQKMNLDGDGEGANDRSKQCIRFQTCPKSGS